MKIDNDFVKWKRLNYSFAELLMRFFDLMNLGDFQ